jgi:outer membrane protein assembly factor BamB
VCSGDAGRGVELARTGRWIVHALCGSEAATGKARAAFAEARVYGLASAEHRPRLESLPYANRLVNLVIVDDWADAAKRGLTWAECLRVTTPRGTVLVGGAALDEVKAQLSRQGMAVQEIARDGDLVRITTAWPADIGQWTHNRYRDAGNQALATDPINPATQNLWFQWIDGPPNGAGHHGVMGAIVSADGRLITLADYEAAALFRDGKFWGSRPFHQVFALSCRDAFNGTVQWVRPWNGINIKKAKRSLAVVGDRIYTVEAGRLTATDARDGSILYAAEASHAGQTTCRWMNIRDGNGMYAAKAPENFRFHFDSWLHCDEKVVAVHDPAARDLWVFEAASGKLLWKGPEAVAWAALDGGRIFVGLEVPDQAKSTELRAFDAVSGKLLWKKTPGDLGETEGGRLALHVASMGMVLASVGKSATVVLNGTSGEVVHRLEAQGDPRFVGDRIVTGSKWFDLKTGALTGEAARPSPHAAMGMWACSAGAYTQRQFLDALTDGVKPAKGRDRPVLQHPHMGSARTHNVCITGDIVAHGLIYQPEQGCMCGTPYRGGRVRGLYALGPVEVAPPQRAFEEPGVLEKGPAFGKVDAKGLPDTAAGDWPMLRADPERSCSSDANIPARIEVLWRTPLAARPDAWVVRSSWRAQHHHNQTISAPVVAGGKVFVALVDEHQVVAMDAAGGEVLWRFTANARVDSPPTIHKGLCLFGCRDGWVYCLRADDGVLAWRRRITPLDQRILVYGQLESRWPVVGSVLVNGSRAYATAGHDEGLGILLWEFDPATGATLAYRAAPPSQFPNGILVRGEDGGIYLSRAAVTPSPSAATQPAAAKRLVGPLKRTIPVLPDHLMPVETPILSTGGTTWTGPMRVGAQFMRQICANRWTWDIQRLIGFTDRGYKAGGLTPHAGWNDANVSAGAIFRIDPSKLAGEAGKALLWQTPAQYDVWAMALAGDRLVSGGPRIDRPESAVPATQPAPTRAPSYSETIVRLAQALPRDSQPATAPAEPPYKSLPVGKPAELLWNPEFLQSEMICRWFVRHQDPLTAPGFVRVHGAADGKASAEIQLGSAPVQDGIAIVRGHLYVTTADGSVLCLGSRRPN